MRGKRQPKPLTCTRIIIDSSPLAIFLCATEQQGGFDGGNMQRICSNDKQVAFYRQHGEEVLKIIGRKRILITPHVVAEVSNLAKKNRFEVGKLINKDNIIVKLLLSKGIEQHLSLEQLLQKEIFCRDGNLGVTDCALMILSRETDLLLTHDEELRQRAQQRGIDAMLPQDVYYSVAGYQRVRAQS